MLKVTIRFYEELNDFLHESRRKTNFTVECKEKRSVKDMIESLGIPHTEVDLILVDGISVDFKYLLQDCDKVSVYPTFEALNLENVTRLRDIPLRKTCFVADVNLGDIVKLMRLLGFDIAFNPTFSSMAIIETAQKEKRIILATSRKLLKFKAVTHGIYLRPGSTQEQVVHIINFLDIKANISPFSRCLLCNTPLEPIDKKIIEDRIPPKTKVLCDEYSHCASCDKIFWEGTHFSKLNAKVEKILQALGV